jgi:hypothetical protein
VCPRWHWALTSPLIMCTADVQWFGPDSQAQPLNMLYHNGQYSIWYPAEQQSPSSNKDGLQPPQGALMQPALYDAAPCGDHRVQTLPFHAPEHMRHAYPSHVWPPAVSCLETCVYLDLSPTHDQTSVVASAQKLGSEYETADRSGASWRATQVQTCCMMLVFAHNNLELLHRRRWNSAYGQIWCLGRWQHSKRCHGQRRFQYNRHA